MDMLSIFLIGVSLAMDAFAVSITNGITQTRSRFPQALVSSASFGFFQGFMPFIGWALGAAFSARIEKIDHWIAFGLLAFIGIHMIWEAVRGGETCEGGASEFSMKTLMVLSLATSIDALAVGVSFALTGTATLAGILLNCSIIAGVTLVICLAGFYIGRRFGCLYKQKAEIAGGCILTLMGIKILIEHLFFS
ncbi:MAG: manganese efflux pump [Clostridiales bacterium]|nr:manganese efflux pump [Clostridiales bacterium]